MRSTVSRSATRWTPSSTWLPFSAGRLEIFFITGADAVLDILTWKAPARVLELCTLIAATRPGYDLSRLSAVFEKLGPGMADPGLDARVRAMEIPALAVSSSMIRERLASGKPIRYLVPDVAAQLIEKAGLYSTSASSGPTGAAGDR